MSSFQNTVIVSFWILSILTSCTTVSGWFGYGEESKESTIELENSPKPEATPAAYVPKATIDDQKLSEMVARMEQLEENVKRYRAEVEVLRRAQVLGFMPDNFGPDSGASYKGSRVLPETSKNIEKSASEPVELGHKFSDPDPSVHDGGDDGHASLSERKSADELLAAATEEFEKGNFGKAINLYWKLEGKTENKSYLYWIGLCWFSLKEYQISRFQFEQFLASTADDTKVPSAKYYIAEVDLALGLKQRAVEGFQNVVKSFPDSNAAAMASKSLKAVSSIY